jgi:hypothetical protein
MEKRLAFSDKKRRWLHLIYYTLLVLFAASFAEVGARIKGFRPWQAPRADIVVEPGGKFYAKSPTLGYVSLPGKFRVTLAGTYSFEVTNLVNSLRATRPPDAHPAGARKGIWIFGDSVTYGWSVNDRDTYCWLLQEDLPDYEVVNFGVNGYGTLQSLIQLREALKNGNEPQVVILAYAPWQDVRNTFIRMRRKMLVPAAYLGAVNQPYARLDREGRLDIFTDALPYREFPLMRYSAFIHALEESYDKYEERHSQSHEVTEVIIKDISDLCIGHGINFVVASLTSDPISSDMLEYCRRERITTADAWVDLAIKENNNLPYDSHPSAIAHRQYARKLESFLRSNVLDKPVGN